MKKALLTLSILLFAAISIFPQETKKINLSDYIGVYSVEKADVAQVTILLNNGKLFASFGNISGLEMTNTDENKFETNESGYKIEFTRSKEGTVEKILVIRPGKSNIEGKKQAENSLNDYVGEYYRTDKDDPTHLFVTCEGNKLFGEADGRKFEFNQLKGDDFEIKELSSGVIFTRNNLGKVDGIRLIRSDGNETTGKKVEKK